MTSFHLKAPVKLSGFVISATIMHPKAPFTYNFDTAVNLS